VSLQTGLETAEHAILPSMICCKSLRLWHLFEIKMATWFI
jgi:hypothetical protein